MEEVWVLTRNRTHKGAYDGPPHSGATINDALRRFATVVFTPEPCNIDQAVWIEYVTPHARVSLPPFCKRCFKSVGA